MIHVQLPQFEGPLGLLLYLIRREELDIYNIPIHKITQQYLDHLKKMRELDLEVAGEFVAMAATLIHIKSRMLLPQYDENGEQVENTEDPRKELVQKLIEYQKYQEASKSLNDRPLLGRDVWARGIREDFEAEEDTDIIVDEGGLFALISVYRKMMNQLSKAVHKVREKSQSIASRILELKDRLIVGQRTTLNELVLFGEKTTNKVLITFLSLLELTKMGFTSLFQAENYGEIYIDPLKPVDRNVIDRVEEYDRKPEQAQAVAAEIEGEATFEANILHPESQTQFSEMPEAQLTQEPQDLSLQVAGAITELAESAENHANPFALKEADLGLPEEIASDDDILEAERAMGLSGHEVDLSAVDRALESFALEKPLENSESVAELIDSSSSEKNIADTDSSLEIQVSASEIQTEPSRIESSMSEFISNDDFEMAWASFVGDEATPVQESQNLAEDTQPPEVNSSQATFSEQEELTETIKFNEQVEVVPEVIEDEIEDFVIADARLNDNDGNNRDPEAGL